MKNFIKTVVSFVAGAAMGGVVAYELAKRKFASRIEAEIESIKNMYKEFDNQTKAYSAKNKPDIDVIVKAIDNEDTDKVEKKSKTGKKKRYSQKRKRIYELFGILCARRDADRSRSRS